MICMVIASQKHNKEMLFESLVIAKAEDEQKHNTFATT